MRQTATRKQLLDILKKTPGPISAEEILQRIPVNKTTIYRQLSSLHAAGLISDIRFADRKVRYELTRDHHHHLVCTNCNSVSDVVLPENLDTLASQSTSARNFLITSHYLEFFGLCHNCQSA